MKRHDDTHIEVTLVEGVAEDRPKKNLLMQCQLQINGSPTGLVRDSSGLWFPEFITGKTWDAKQLGNGDVASTNCTARVEDWYISTLD